VPVMTMTVLPFGMMADMTRMGVPPCPVVRPC
jgi:hypothetical protein